MEVTVSSVVAICGVLISGYTLVNIKKYKDELDKYKHKTNTIEQINKKLKKEINENKNQYINLERENVKYRETITQQNIYSVQINESIIKKDNEINRLKEQNIRYLNNEKYLKQKINDLEFELKNLLQPITINNEIIKYKKDNETLKTQVKSLKDSISKNENEYNVLQNKLKFCDEKIKKLESELTKKMISNSDNELKIKELEYKILDLKSKNNELKEKDEETDFKSLNLNENYEELDNYQSKEIALTKLIEKDSESDKVNIDYFRLKTTENVLFEQHNEKIQKSFLKVKDIKNIKQFLEVNDFDEKEIFIKIIDKYEKELNKLISKIDLDEDDEEISEIITDKFFANLEKNFINKFMVSIYRGMDKNKDTYKLFIGEVNTYLSNCNVYTRDVYSNHIVQNKDYEDMNIQSKKVDDEKLNNLIEEVEMLPYYINYLNDMGDKETMTIRGKITVCSTNL